MLVEYLDLRCLKWLAQIYLVFLVLSIPSFASSAKPYVEGQVIVRFASPTTLDGARMILDGNELSVRDALVPSLDIFLVELKGGLEVPDALQRLKTHPSLLWAQADHLLELRRTIPNDPVFSQQWSLDQASDVDIDAPEAWDLTRGGTTPSGRPIVVAVVDGGCQITHTDLTANLWVNPGEVAGNGIDDDGNGYVDDINGWNAYDNNGTIPVDGHGTHVSGIIGASGNNGLMIAGVNWNVKLMEVAAASGATSVVSIGYNYVLTQKNRWWSSGGTQGANVVATNSSFGVDSANCNSGDYPIWNNLYAALGQAGILNAVATANRNWNVDSTGDVPSACSSPYIISVTNTTNTDQRNPGAAYGPINIDLGAPGSGILSTVPVNTYGFMSGTSMASPHVAGTIALMHAIASPVFASYYQTDRANATLALKQLIMSNVDPIAALQGITVSGGRLNLYNAVHAIRHYGAPENDHCPGYYITALPYNHSGTTATANNDYQNCVGWWSPEVVYTMLLPCSTSVTVSLCGSGYDTGLEVRSGGDCPGSFLVACNDDYSGCANPLHSQVQFEARADQFYYLIVHGYGTNSGNYTLNVTGPTRAPLNDACPGKSISALPYSDAGNTWCAYSDYGGKCVGANSPDVFYTLNLAVCHTVTVSLCGSPYDTGLEVRAGGSCPGSSTVACDDDYCGSYGASQVSFVAQAGVNYYILVHGYGMARGSYVINVTGTPFSDPNDHCPGQLIVALPFTGYGNTRCATPDATNCRGYNPADVFYRYTAPVCQTVTATLCGSGYDTVLEVRRDGACPGTTVVACNDDSTCGGSYSLQSTVVFDAEAGVTYYIHVSGYGSAVGPYTLNLSAVPLAPANDRCPGATVTGIPFTINGSTLCATNDYGNCVDPLSPEVVYTMNLAVARTVTVSLCGSGFDTGLGVRTGGACPGATEVACNDDELCGGNPSYQSTITFNALANTNYYFLIHGFRGAVGPYTLSVTGTFASPDSLVILPVFPRVYLYWSAVGGAGSYNVYRDTIPDVRRIPGNLIGSPGAPSFIDLTALNDPQVRRFYCVTAVIPQSTTGETQENSVSLAVKAPVVNQSPEKQTAVVPADLFIAAYAEYATMNQSPPGK